MKTAREWAVKLIPAFMQDWRNFFSNFTGVEETKPVENVENIVKEIQLDAGAHPDDEQPITEEWLLSVGFEHTPENYHVLSDGYKEIPLDFLSKGVFYDTNTGFEMPTRRHVRLLAELLGVTLNE